MLEERFFRRAAAILGAIVLWGGLAQAAVLYTGTVTLVNTDPTQLGRLLRDSVTSDWSFQKPFPGVINFTASFHYKTIAVRVPSWLPFLQIGIDSNDNNIFASVYDTSYNPNPIAPDRGLDTNYLGDPGFSGNFFGNPLFFQVIDFTAAGSSSGFGTAVVVLNETNPNGGLNSPVGVVVEGFSDTGFDDIPEPATSGLLAVGTLTLAAAWRRRGRATRGPLASQ